MRISDWSSDVCSSDLRAPQLGTTGGTSDARFIKDHCTVAELGLLNATAHKVDEHVPLDHLARLTRSEEHTSALQSLMRISYAVFCLKKKKLTNTRHHAHSLQKETYTTKQTSDTTTYHPELTPHT